MMLRRWDSDHDGIDGRIRQHFLQVIRGLGAILGFHLRQHCSAFIAHPCQRSELMEVTYQVLAPIPSADDCNFQVQAWHPILPLVEF